MTALANIEIPPINDDIAIKLLGQADYQTVWNQMREFNERRDSGTKDEIWIVEHPAVFTLGLNGKDEHILNANDIPVIKCDRGGQVTYHGPGQLVAYIMMDLERKHWGVKKLVNQLEQAVIELLKEYGIEGQRIEKAPGVYVNSSKIAALGLRVRRGCSYHGLSLNVDMNLSPFSLINPCGYEGLESTQLRDLIDIVDINKTATQLIAHLDRQLYGAIEP